MPALTTQSKRRAACVSVIVSVLYSVLRAATANAQAAENGDATDEVRALSLKSMCYIQGLLYRMIKNLGASQGGASRSCSCSCSCCCAHFMHPEELELEG